MESEQNKSLLWMVAMVALVIALFGWAFLAAGYAHHAEGWRQGGAETADEIGGSSSGRRGATTSVRRVASRAFADFVMNAFRQVPNFPQVIAHNLQHRLWLVGLLVGLEGLVIFGGWKLRHLDRELAGHPYEIPGRRRAASRKRRAPAKKNRSRPRPPA